MASSAYESSLHYVDEHLSTYLKAWQRLFQEQHRPQHDARSPLEALKILFQRHGLQTSQPDHDLPFLSGEQHSPTPRTLLFYNRYSSPTSRLWELIPIVTRLLALDIYKELYDDFPVNITWLIDGSHEDHDAALRSMLAEQQNHLLADGCLWDDTRGMEEAGLLEMDAPLLALGAKGLLSVSLEVLTAPRPLPSMHGAIVPNAGWRLLWVLNSLKDAREEILIDGFYDTLTSSDDETVEPLYMLSDNAPSLIKRWGVNALLHNLTGLQLHYAQLLVPTCSINTFQTFAGEDGDPPQWGGSGNSASTVDYATIIPNRARAQIDFHLVPEQDPQDIFAKLQRHLQEQGFTDVQASILFSRPPAHTSLHNPFAQSIRHATTIAYGREPLVLPLSPMSQPLHIVQSMLKAPPIITTMNTNDFKIHAGEVEVNAQSISSYIKQILIIIETQRTNG